MGIVRKFCIAPMMNWTDRHCRYFMRLISQKAILYTEMITTGALIHGDSSYYLQMNPDESPVSLQLGGSSPQELEKCARLVERYNYSEINLNCGCPSDRVQNGMFGAVMMKNAKLTAECVSSLLNSCQLPITVKHRIGVDDFDSYEFLCDFIGTVSDVGCKVFIIHARKAWLKGLSPKQNREIPELNYDRVYQLKNDFPNLEIVINGGITSIEDSIKHLKVLDGVMIGREAYTNPYFLANVDQKIYGLDKSMLKREEIAEKFFEYIDNEMRKGTKLHAMTRHMLGLFRGVKGAKQFRRYLSENAYSENASIDVLYKALSKTLGSGTDEFSQSA